MSASRSATAAARAEPALATNPNLLRAALRARVRTITNGLVDQEPDADLSVVAILVESSSDSDGADAGPARRAFCQASDRRGLGSTLRWAMSNDVTELDLIVEAPAAGEVMRRAGLMKPDELGLELTVWSAEGAEVRPAVADALVPSPPLDPHCAPFGELIERCGARAIDDYSMLVAEVDGLEVARVVRPDDDPLGELHLSVGVGQADRELQAYVHGHLDDETNLRRAIEVVREHRNPASASHPLSRLARERWLRSVALADPSVVGLDELAPVSPLRPRETLLGTEPCAAVGRGPHGPAVVVFSVGVDLDLLPEAVDYRHREALLASSEGRRVSNEDFELVVVLPERDGRLAVGNLDGAMSGLRLAQMSLPWDLA